MIIAPPEGMDYKQTLDTLYNMLPDFQQVGAEAYKPGLDRIRCFTALLGDPQSKYDVIHVAGTNGKGSVSHMLASVLTASGYKTGLYTSPHLRDFRERIRIDGEMIPEDDMVRFADRHMDEMERRGLSFFEATAAMAFDHFARKGVRVAVVETGLGGRLDATNIVNPALSVITNIGLDHTALLGESPAAIAAEKAGIVKPGVPVIIGEEDAETAPVFRSAAACAGSPLVFAEKWYAFVSCERPPESHPEGPGAPAGEHLHGKLVYNIKDLRDGTVTGYPLDLEGIYQRRNIVTALAAIDALRDTGRFDLPQPAIMEGLASAAFSTGLKGRWEILGREPLVVCDTGHNPHGIKEVVKQIGGERFRKLYMVVGFVRDKDIDSILPLLPKDAYYIFTAPSVHRALPAGELATLASLHGLGGRTVESVPQAVAAALSMAGPEDMVFIGGSSFVVADIELPG